MDAQQRDAYVRAALALQGFAFDETIIAGIVAHFERIESLAATLANADLPPATNSAESFRP